MVHLIITSPWTRNTDCRIGISYLNLDYRLLNVERPRMIYCNLDCNHGDAVDTG